MLEEIWETITDELGYFLSFEWLGDTWEFITGLFGNLSEFSTMGLLGGIVTVFLTHITLGKLDYVTGLTGVSYIINVGIFYIFGFVLGYIMVKRFF